MEPRTVLACLLLYPPWTVSRLEVLRVLPFLPPGHLGRVPVPGPPLGLNGLHYDPAHVGKRTVYIPVSYTHLTLPTIYSV